CPWPPLEAQLRADPRSRMGRATPRLADSPLGRHRRRGIFRPIGPRPRGGHVDGTSERVAATVGTIDEAPSRHPHPSVSGGNAYGRPGSWAAPLDVLLVSLDPDVAEISALP